MTKEELSQLTNLRKEIQELEEKIRRIEEREYSMVTDKVKASSRDWPYTEVNVTIQGNVYVLDKKSRKEKREKLALLRQRRQQALELELRITKYINTIQNSEIRRMIEYKYIDGCTWAELGQIFHCDRTAAEKKVSNYLKRHQG